MDGYIIGLRLAKLRENSGLTQEQVAEKAQLNLSDYQAMEEGKLLDNKERLEKACNALDIKIEDLFDSHTFINYGDNKLESGSNIVSYHQNIYNNRNDEDMAFMKDMADNLRAVSEHMDVLNSSIIRLFERMDDAVLKKRMEEILKDLPNKGKDKSN